MLAIGGWRGQFYEDASTLHLPNFGCLEVELGDEGVKKQRSFRRLFRNSDTVHTDYVTERI